MHKGYALPARLTASVSPDALITFSLISAMIYSSCFASSAAPITPTR